jgi:glucosamine--fructose-6-phosphate aminotransferase (isomerizing)
MCGIAGIIGNVNVYDYLIMAISMLMNRGYDSMGICTIRVTKGIAFTSGEGTLTNNQFGEENKFIIDKFASKENILAIDLLKQTKNNHQDRNIGICHARWSTHGAKTDINAHPHNDTYDLFSIVHNGIIENYLELKEKLIKNNYKFKSETDTEVIVNLISYHFFNLNSQNINKSDIIKKSIENALFELEGTYALAIIYKNDPNTLYCVRQGSPLLVSVNNNFGFITSEKSGFCDKVNSYIALENNDLCIINKTETGINMTTSKCYKDKIKKITNESLLENETFNNSCLPFSHWTLKEIIEQPISIDRSIGMGGRILNESMVKLDGLERMKDKLIKIQNIILLGCGTSYHSALVGAEYMKDLCNFNVVQVFDGGSFTKKDIPKIGYTGIIYISQSGETKDLHRCLELVKDLDVINIGVINVVDSLIAREVDCGVYLNAGREVAVASTKAFTSQVIVLSLISIWFAQINNINEKKRINYISCLNKLKFDLQQLIINCQDKCKEISKLLVNKNSMFILGKGILEFVAKEGALKIKEIGYIHAEGFCSTALKHGPYSLIENNTPIILLTPNDEFFVRNQGILEEIKSRHAFVIGISDIQLSDKCNIQIYIPSNKIYQNILSIIPMQFIAYFLAIDKNNNPDYPRNLAKVVTVD